MFPDAYPSHIGQPLPRKHSNAPRLIPVVLPTNEVVGPNDYNTYMKVGSQQPDLNLLYDKIQSARELCENYVGQRFVAGQWDLYYDFVGPFFSGWTNFRLAEYFNVLELPLFPGVCVQGIWLRDSTGAESQLDATMFNVSQTRRPLRVTINTWPFMEVLNYPYIEQLRIRFTAGYVSPAVFNTSTHQIRTQVPHGFSPSGKTPTYNSVRFRAVSPDYSAGVLPTGLVERVDYYAQYVDDYTFSLSSDPAGSSPVSFTTTGTGTIFASLQEGGLPISINRAILSVASRDRFAADPRSLRKIDAETDMPKEAAAILRRFRRITCT